MKHWAFDLIGMDYFKAGTCRGLVSTCCLRRFAEPLPETGRAARVGGWRRVSAAVADDVVVMLDMRGFRHVGFVVDDGLGGLGMLHAFGTPAKGGAVVFDPWPDAVARGLHNFEFWRHASRRSHAHSPALQ